MFSIARNPSPFFSIRSVLKAGRALESRVTVAKHQRQRSGILPPALPSIRLRFLRQSAHHRHSSPPAAPDKRLDDIMSLFRLKTKETGNYSVIHWSGHFYQIAFHMEAGKLVPMIEPRS